ncbi:hypothetical protein [Streptomyces sp. NPDC018347]|uniref:hypothetical protein n=1 Tax=Streptomyces sp. NPDC018347 TaxID=3157193 RepID=UPI0033DF2E9E
MADERRTGTPGGAGHPRGRSAGGVRADPASLGPVRVTYRERPTVGKAAVVVVPPVVVWLTGGPPTAVPSFWRGAFLTVCLLVFVPGVWGLFRSCTTWLELREGGLVHRGRRRVRWAHAWADFREGTLTREGTAVDGAALPSRLRAVLWPDGRDGARRLTGSSFLSDTPGGGGAGAGYLTLLRRGGPTLTEALAGIMVRIADARARHDLLRLALPEAEVRYGSLLLDGVGLHVDDAAEDVPWEDVTRIRVLDDLISVSAPGLGRRLRGAKLKTQILGPSFRLGEDTLSIEPGNLTPLRHAVVWTVMSHLADALEKGRRAG